ncbi:MAG TPA: hypothetical protein VL984_11235 [Acidimicrobiales bacterium]|nr:hypothetical protein [Acidimicrobiales bacterium]
MALVLLGSVAASFASTVAHVPVPGPGAGRLAPPSAVKASHVPTGLQAAIDKTLSAVPESSPSGLSLQWGTYGTAWFSLANGGGRFGLEPVSIGRSGREPLSQGPFVFGGTRTTEALGHGLDVWYQDRSSGFEQGFTLRNRPAGPGQSFAISLAYLGNVRLSAQDRRAVTISGPRGALVGYGGLRATDAKGRVLPARIVAEKGHLELVVRDAGAVYPVTLDPYIAPSTNPAATFNGPSGAGGALGTSVALSSDGGTALVGAPNLNSNAGAAYVYTSAAGTWSTTPAATFNGTGTEELGWSVALSGNGETALVGTYGAAPGGNGAAFVYSASGGTWTGDPAPAATFNGTGGEELGFSVSLSGNGGMALVGAPAAGSGGAAYVYSAPGGTWSTTPVATFAGSGNEALGGSVSISSDGETALVGAANAGSGNAGAAYVYTASGGTWATSPSPVATFTGASGDSLGYSVALSGDGQTALVGARDANSEGGAAYVYTASGGTWSSTPAPVATINGAGGEFLGFSVALSADGETALVGAANENGDGAAYVYSASGGTWPATPAPVATFNGSGGEALGDSVALSGDGETVLVGAFAANSGDGAALVYSVAAASFTGGQAADLGNAVALSADGETALVGAPGAGSGSGAAYIYTVNGGTWSTTPVATFSGSAGAELGYSVALSGDGATALIGAYGAGSGSGAAYVYTGPGGSWSTTPAAMVSGSAGAELGYSVALSGDGETALVGAPGASSGNGAAYVYTASGTWATNPSPTATFSGGGGEDFGNSVALSNDGETALVGAPGANSGNGAAFLYDAPAGAWLTTPASTLIGGVSEQLGWSVAVSSDAGTVLVGGPGATSFRGASHVYTPAHIACPAGSYSASGAAPCTTTPAGDYDAGTGNTTTTPCPSGTYNASAGQASCTTTPAGDYDAGTGNTSPKPCPSGTTSAAGAAACTATSESLSYNGPSQVGVSSSFVPTATLGSSNPACVASQAISFSLSVNPLNDQAITYNLGNPVSSTSTGAVAGASVSTTGWQDGVYAITASYAGATVGAVSCPAATTTGSLAVTVPGQLAFGYGWYNVNGLGATNFGFVVSLAPHSKTSYVGELDVVTPGKWMLQANVTSYGKTSATQGLLGGTGSLYWWESSLNKGHGGWALAKSGVSYKATANAAAKNAPASFGVTITYTPVSPQPTPLPNSSPLALSKGAILVS